MKICIIGLGSIGGYLAFRLAQAGRDVCAVARGATLQSVQQHGLLLSHVDTPEQISSVPLTVSDSPAQLGPQELVIVALKTTALDALPSLIGPLLGPQTMVMWAMNGVPYWLMKGLDARWRDIRLEATDPGGRLEAAIDPGRIIGCVAHMAASCPHPGHVVQAFGDRFIIGEPGGAQTERLAAVTQALSVPGIGLEVSDAIEEAIWLKLWGNMTMNPVSALTGATLDRILDEPMVRRFVSAAMLEATAIGDRIGLSVGMTPEDRHAITRKLGAVRTSMLQDVQAGRAIELDALTASVSELGRGIGIETPNIDALLGMTRLFDSVRTQRLQQQGA
jgi:2-dehydropantoate 2-reductase